MAENFDYKGWDLFEAIDGLMAYDCGATDSGIKDDLLKEEVQDYILGLNDKDFNEVLSKFARQYLTDEMIEQGYGLISVKEFIDWLHELRIDL